MGKLKQGVATQHVAPKGDMGRLPMALQVGRRHAEGEDVHLKRRLAGIESAIGNGVNLFDDRVGHGKAAGGEPFAVDHDHSTRGMPRLIIEIGVADVEGEVEVAPRIHS